MYNLVFVLTVTYNCLSILSLLRRLFPVKYLIFVATVSFNKNKYFVVKRVL